MEENGAVSNFEAQIQRKDGQIIWISENARTVRDESGAPAYYEGTVEDITARKNAEEQLFARRSARQTDRTLQSRAVHGQAQPGICAPETPPPRHSRCCFWILTASKASMIRSATWRATNF